MIKFKMPSSGDLIEGRYKLGHKLGEGGMGAVYAATHTRLSRAVAIKLLKPEHSLDEHFRKRFQREALVMSKISHPNVITVIDYGVHDNCLYLVMERVFGDQLRFHLEAHPRGLELDKILDYGGALADALTATHAHEIVHRDLKPENILVEELAGGKERLVVLDFGLAFIDRSEDMGRMTQAGWTAGTPQYISPEQATGDPITPAADIYSLGCLLYEMCSGAPPFMATTVLKLLNKHVYNTPMPLRQRCKKRHDIPPLLEHIVMAALTKEPEGRPSAVRMAGVLTELRDETPRDNHEVRGKMAVRSRDSRQMTAHQLHTPITSPLKDAEGALNQPRDGVRVAFMGKKLDEELIDALAVQGVQCMMMEDIGDEFDAIFVPDADAAQIEALGKHDVPIIAACKPDDMERLTELMRGGAAEVAVLPFQPRSAARKIQRAIRKAKRSKPQDE